jgi:osmotically-inducible protein OsmY
MQGRLGHRAMQISLEDLHDNSDLTRTDREIQADVLAELRGDSSIPGTERGVTVKDDVVTLIGTVDTFMKKWRADEDAHKVNGVIAVANDIRARVTGERTDTNIAAAALHALKWNTNVKAEKIPVAVEDGWVTRSRAKWYGNTKSRKLNASDAGSGVSRV